MSDGREFQFNHGPFDDAILRFRAIARHVPGAIEAFSEIQGADEVCRIETRIGSMSATIFPSERFLSLIEMFEADQLARMSSMETA